MTDVGVRELKQHLSEYLDRAAAGETVRVTDRGRPKALIAPLPGADRLQRGLEEGWVRRPAAGSGGLAPANPVRGSRPSAEVLAEDRGE